MAEKWIPKVPDFLPAKEVIIIAICLDGKRKVPGGQTKIDLLDCRRMLRKMSRRLSDNQVLDVRLEEVSFWDDAAEFTRKIVNCDWFVMCGFTGGERLIDEVWLRNHAEMRRKRQLVTARVQCNHMAMWGVCGSAVAMGNRWQTDFSRRRLDPRTHQMLEILPGCEMNYQSSSGPALIIDDNMDKFQITSGSGIIMVATETRR